MPKDRFFGSRGIAAVFALALITAMVLASGCAKKPVPSPGDQPAQVPSTEMMATDKLMSEADKAWTGRDWERAELYYSRLWMRTDLPESEWPTVLERLAKSAFYSKHFHQCRKALLSWAEISPEVKDSWTWHDLYVRTLQESGQGERAEKHLLALSLDQDKSWPLKLKAGLALADSQWKGGDYGASMNTWARTYVQAPDVQSRKSLESNFSALLDKAGGQVLKDVFASVTPGNELAFPYALAAWARARSMVSRDSESWPAAWRAMTRLAEEARLVDRSAMKAELADLEKDYGIPRQGVALALPLSGRYAPVGWKILRGVGAAQWRLAKSGQEVEITVVNTAASDWLATLNELPPHFSVVGGPLRVSAFKEIVSSGLLEKRVFFAFLQSLGADTVEGRDGWRFFTSRKDQVRGVVSFAMNDLGIENMAVLYPEERYGRGMARLFWEALSENGGHLTGLETYPPGDPSAYGRSVSRLLRVPEDEPDTVEDMRAEPDFGAVFIPDSWGHALMMAPQFHFYEEDRMVILGPELWSQALGGGRDVESRYFRLAACPGAWSPYSPGAKELAYVLDQEALGKPDFWTALGYDFLRFASGLGNFPSPIRASAVNERTRLAQSMTFSLAPFHWSEDGVASQDLYLFRPVRKGMTRVDPEAFSERLAQTVERRLSIIEAKRQELEAKALEDMGLMPVGTFTHPDQEPGGGEAVETDLPESNESQGGDATATPPAW